MVGSAVIRQLNIFWSGISPHCVWALPLPLDLTHAMTLSNEYLAFWQVSIILQNLEQLAFCILSYNHNLLQRNIRFLTRQMQILTKGVLFDSFCVSACVCVQTAVMSRELKVPRFQSQSCQRAGLYLGAEDLS